MGPVPAREGLGLPHAGPQCRGDLASSRRLGHLLKLHGEFAPAARPETKVRRPHRTLHGPRVALPFHRLDDERQVVQSTQVRDLALPVCLSSRRRGRSSCSTSLAHFPFGPRGSIASGTQRYLVPPDVNTRDPKNSGLLPVWRRRDARSLSAFSHSPADGCPETTSQEVDGGKLLSHHRTHAPSADADVVRASIPIDTSSTTSRFEFISTRLQVRSSMVASRLARRRTC